MLWRIAMVEHYVVMQGARAVAHYLEEHVVDVDAIGGVFFFQAEDGIRDLTVTGVQTCALPISPVGLDAVATTKAYYRSTYYFIYRADRGLQIRSLDDTVLKHLKIGVNIIGYDYTNTPPAHALAQRGIVGLVGFGNFLNADPKADHPEDIVEAVARDSINLAIVWGPKAGYWVKRAAVPLSMVPLPDSDAVSGVPFAFDMAMGVRHRDRELKAQLDSVIERRRADIVAILNEYSVPLLATHP